jgi:hypothetical protein
LDVWEFCQSQEIAPDLVLIRGQFRLACLLATILFAKSGCRIVIADYRENAYDPDLEKLIRPAAIVGRSAEFLVSPEMSAERERFWRMLLRALIDPR